MIVTQFARRLAGPLALLFILMTGTGCPWVKDLGVYLPDPDDPAAKITFKFTVTSFGHQLWNVVLTPPGADKKEEFQLLKHESRTFTFHGTRGRDHVGVFAELADDPDFHRTESCPGTTKTIALKVIHEGGVSLIAVEDGFGDPETLSIQCRYQ